jgi:hypothetical protein
MVLKLSRGGEIVPGADQKLSLEALFKHEDHSCAGDREVAAVEELLRTASFESNVIAAAAERTSLVAEAAATAVAAAMSTFIRSATTKKKYISTVCAAAAAAATEPPPPLDSASSTPSSYSAAAQAMPILCRLQQKKHVMINPAAYHATGADMQKQPGGHLLTWLDAMKAQSPPHFHSSTLHASDHDHTLESPQSCTYDMQLRESAAAAAYTAWVVSKRNSIVQSSTWASTPLVSSDSFNISSSLTSTSSKSSSGLGPLSSVLSLLLSFLPALTCTITESH